MSAELRYLALGDSYTIGTGASAKKKNFPTLLARALAKKTGRLVDIENPALNGATADDLIRTQLPMVAAFQPDVASVLVGANDIVQGRSQAEYQQAIEWIYGALAGVSKVVTIGIPDWSLTPAAGQFGPRDTLRQRIEGFNELARQAATAAGYPWVDLGQLSRRAAEETDWTSSDGLHPADAQYQAWANAIWAELEPGWASSEAAL